MRFNTLSHDGEHRLRSVYNGIKDRCYNPNSKSYRYYGARGICMCDLWLNSYSEFHDWAIENGYIEDAPCGKCTIDRIDVNGNYEPDNCRWVDMKVQNVNRRKPWHIQLPEVNPNLNETRTAIVKNIAEHIHTYIDDNMTTISKFSVSVGISRSSLYSKLRGDNDYTFPEVIRIAELIGCTIDELVNTPHEIH